MVCLEITRLFLETYLFTHYLNRSKKALLLQYFTENHTEGTQKSPLCLSKILRMEIREVLWQLAEENLKDDSYFLVDIIVKGTGGGKMKVLILLDGDEGVNIDDCADLSRAIGMRVEAEDLIEQAYILEVSSPGLDHPLKLNRQYLNNIGRRLKLQLTDGKQITGKLVEAREADISFEKEVKEKKKTVHQLMTIGFDEIEKANVLVSFK